MNIQMYTPKAVRSGKPIKRSYWSDNHSDVYSLIEIFSDFFNRIIFYETWCFVSRLCFRLQARKSLNLVESLQTDG